MPIKPLNEVISDVELALQTAKNNLNAIATARNALQDFTELNPSLNSNLDELEDSVRTGLLASLKKL